MKQVSRLGLVVGFILSLAMVKEDINAITITNLRLLPTSIPTPTVEITPTVAEVTVTPVISPVITPLDTDQPAAINQSSKDMTFWFLVVTIGLLAVIIIVQAWPRKNLEE